LFYVFLVSNSFSQQINTAVYVVDAVTQKPIPFPVISCEGDSLEYLGNMEGGLLVPLKKKEVRIRVRAYQYLDEEMNVKPGDSVKISLHYAHPFTWQNLSLQAEKKLVMQLLRNKSNADPGQEEHYRYRSYNKTLVTTSNMPGLKLYLDNLLRFFTKARMGQYSLEHHIFLMESASRREYVSINRQRETVIATQASGISQPPPLSYISGFDALSVYNPFLRIGTKKYISPLTGRALSRYAFSIVDTIKTGQGKVIVLKFNPLNHRKKDLLQGILYVSTNPSGIMAFQVWPSYEPESTFSLAQEAFLLPSGRWYPGVIRTSYMSDGLGSLRIPVLAVSKTRISDFQTVESDSRKFDEVVFDFRHSNLQSDTGFPAKYRLEPLQVKDKNTYSYYQEAGSLKGVDRFLNFGQNLYEGKFPLAGINLIFRDAIRFNDFEGLRLGLGAETNSRFSEKAVFGGYAAYGGRDEKWKYGLHAARKFNDKQSVEVQWKDDLEEPGIFPLAFDRRQYPSEDLRKFRVSRFDAVKSLSFAWLFRPFRNFNSQISLENGTRRFLYTYRYLPLPAMASIGFSEFKVGFCWSPLERFARLENQLYSISSRLPVFWLQYARGFSGILSNSFSYNRLETKMHWNRKIPGLGDFGVRVSAGIQRAGLPYPLLFSARGSYRDFSLLSYNSFETMRYNEFCYDRFVHVFLAHRFGKIQISTLPFLPYFTLMHNMGWGKLSQPDLHDGIRAKDIRNGFFETGLFLNDLFVIPLSGLNLGVGAGIFIRYGPYGLPSDFDNVALKFSASLGI
jgi:hypothetical protein